jgi:hypothetical protein
MNWRWSLTTILTAGLLLGATAGRADDARVDQKKAIQDEIAAFAKQQSEWQKKVTEARREKPPRAVSMADRPKPDAHVQRVLALVKKDPSTPAALEGLIWIARVQPPASFAQTSAVAELILKHHLNNDDSAATIQGFASRSDLIANPMDDKDVAQRVDGDHPIGKLVAAALNSQSKKVRAAAQYGRGLGFLQVVRSIKTAADLDPDAVKSRMEKSVESLNARLANERDEEQKQALERQKERLVSSMNTSIESARTRKAKGQKAMASVPGLNQQAQTFLEQALPLLKEFDPKSASRCQGALNDLHGRLDPGAVAMEIAAEDVEGKPFKLSDYRGKVILLDFWGHW